jgi:hypothetical protein
LNYSLAPQILVRILELHLKLVINYGFIIA